MDQRRQRLLVSNPQNKTALVIGAGSIGSVATMLLARTGLQDITVYDDDVLEEWNCTGGLFDRTFMGKPKVESVQSIVKMATGLEIEVTNKKFVGTGRKYDIVIVGTDSLESRSIIWESTIPCNAYIDARMGGHICEVFTIMNKETNEEDSAKYGKTLDLKVARAVCGTEQTSYVVEHCISMIGRSVRGICNSEEIPFWQYWDAERDETITTPVNNQVESIL